jgi:hypothetical protein
MKIRSKTQHTYNEPLVSAQGNYLDVYILHLQDMLESHQQVPEKISTSTIRDGFSRIIILYVVEEN